MGVNHQWLIVNCHNWTHQHNIQWNFGSNDNILSDEMHFEKPTEKCRPFCSSLDFVMHNCLWRVAQKVASMQGLITGVDFLTHGITLQWRHNEGRGVPNHQPHDCLLKRLFRRRSKKTSKLLVTSLCEGNLPLTGEFPAQMASNTENVSIWWRHHENELSR